MKTKDIKNLKILIQENIKTKFKQAKNLFEQWKQHNQLIKPLQEIIEEKFIKHQIVNNVIQDEKTKLSQLVPYENLGDRCDVLLYTGKIT